MIEKNVTKIKLAKDYGQSKAGAVMVRNLYAGTGPAADLFWEEGVPQEDNRFLIPEWIMEGDYAILEEDFV